MIVTPLSSYLMYDGGMVEQRWSHLVSITISNPKTFEIKLSVWKLIQRTKWVEHEEVEVEVEESENQKEKFSKRWMTDGGGWDVGVGIDHLLDSDVHVWALWIHSRDTRTRTHRLHTAARTRTKRRTQFARAQNTDGKPMKFTNETFVFQAGPVQPDTGRQLIIHWSLAASPTHSVLIYVCIDIFTRQMSF